MRHPMIDEVRDPIRVALDRAERRGAHARLRFDQTESAACSFENGRLKSAGTQQGITVAVTVLADGRLATTVGNVLAELDEMVDRALALARLGSVAHFDAWPAPGETAEVRTYFEATSDLSRAALIEGCQAVVDPLRAYDADLYIAAGAGRSESEGLLLTSGGVEAEKRETLWHLGAYGQRTEDTDMLFAGESRSWRDAGVHWDPAALAEETLEDLRRAETRAEPPEGRCQAVLAPSILGRLLGAVTLGTSGRNVAKGESPLAGRLGERILDPTLTLIDDPHLAGGPGSTKIDGDGIPTRRTVLVQDGVLERFLYDLDSAGLAGTEPTGHAGCRPWCLEVPGGEEEHAALIASLGDGLYVKRLIGFGQSNLANGDFSGNVALGYRVRGGEIVGRVKNTMIAGNVYELLAEGVALSKDRDPVRRMPWARVRDLSVSAAQAH